MPTVRTNGIETYYEEYGDGPPVLLLHGATADHRIWAEQARPLADDYRVVVYDVRGHGRTGGSEREDYSIDLFADDLAALVGALDLDRPAVCGLSMGGMIAQTYAARDPEALSALVSIGADTPEILTRGEWLQRVALWKAVDLVSPVLGSDRVMGAVERGLTLLYGEDANGDLEKAERIQQSHAAEFPEMTDAEEEKLWDALDGHMSMDIDYSAVSVPALLMYGERELDSMRRHAEYMASRIPDAEAREIPEAGHNSHVDNPEFVVAAIREFLADAPVR